MKKLLFLPLFLVLTDSWGAKVVRPKMPVPEQPAEKVAPYDELQEEQEIFYEEFAHPREEINPENWQSMFERMESENEPGPFKETEL